MHRVISAIAMATLLLVWPAHSLAQVGSERLLLDVDLPMKPPGMTGFCFYLGEGTLTVNAAITKPAMVPTDMTVQLRGLMETRQGMVIDRNLSESWPASFAVNGGRYCWSIETRTSEGINNLSQADLGAYASDLSLKMTFASK